MPPIKKFISDVAGFTGAEKALITLLALALILVVGKLVLSGTSAATGKAATSLSGQQTAPNVEFPTQ